MEQVFLSDTELYYTPSELITAKGAFIEGEEAAHISRVMRHSQGDVINVTAGKGIIYKCEIAGIEKKKVYLNITGKLEYKNSFANITFCIPRMKNRERFELALEKCTELGITSFIVFESERTVAKGDKTERWEKIVTAAMKQSLRAWLPKVEFTGNLKELNAREGEIIAFDQNGKRPLKEFVKPGNIESGKKYYFVFGPEGGLSDKELSGLEISEKLTLTPNRLRAETAVITAAALLTVS